MKFVVRPFARLPRVSAPRCRLQQARAVRAFTTTLQRSSVSASAPGSAEAQQQQQQTSVSDTYVKIVEVGPRDGLQNEKKSIPLATKIELIERLAKTGLTTIEAGSFVAPKWVPQMANSAEILEHILQHKISSPAPISYAFLVPNTKGFVNANAILEKHPEAYLTDLPPTPPPWMTEEGSGLGEIEHAAHKPAVELAVFAAASESFSQKNLNCDIATSLDRFREVIRTAKEQPTPTGEPIRVRAYISVVLGCPFEGYDIDPRKVAAIATDLLEMGADEISLGDTTGMGTAPRTKDLLRCVTAAGIRNEDVALHFHDTYGQALVNTAVALEHGIRIFDSAVGGLGGCPYSPGATGNVATENMVYFLESLGMQTGADLDALADIGSWITGELGKTNDSSVGKAVLGARARLAKQA